MDNEIFENIVKKMEDGLLNATGKIVKKVNDINQKLEINEKTFLNLVTKLEKRLDDVHENSGSNEEIMKIKEEIKSLQILRGMVLYGGKRK